MGPTAKLRSSEAAAKLGASLSHVAKTFGLTLRLHQTDVLQPEGRGSGPVLKRGMCLMSCRTEQTLPPILRHVGWRWLEAGLS